jgi:hypothetical protein
MTVFLPTFAMNATRSLTLTQRLLDVFTTLLIKLFIFLQDLLYKGKHWHSSCFSCTMCKNSVVDKPFGSNSDSIYCGPCYDSNFGSKCSACAEVLKIGKTGLVRLMLGKDLFSQA